MAVTIESSKLDHQIFTSPMGRHAIYDSSNNLWIIYCLGGSVYLRKSTDNGSTWAAGISGYTATDINIDCPQESSFVYDSVSNTIFAVYHTMPEEKLYARSFDIATELWNADETELNGVVQPIWHIQIDRDFNGRLWVAYTSYLKYITTTPTCVYYVRRSTNVDDITAWGSDVNLGNSGGFDGFGSVLLKCRNKDATDEVSIVYMKWFDAGNIKLHARVNDGLGDAAGNWGAENAGTTAYSFSTYLGSPLDYTLFYNFRSNPYFSGAWVDADTYIVCIIVAAVIYAWSINWTTGAWTALDSGTVTSANTNTCAVCVGTNDGVIRAFCGYSASLRYTTYTVGTNTWSDTNTIIESEIPYVLNCTAVRAVTNENRIFYQTKASAVL